MKPGSHAQTLQPDQVKPVAQMLTEAFFYSPSYTALFPDPKTRHRKLAYYFRKFLQLHLSSQCIYTTGNEEIESVYLLEPPAGIPLTLRNTLGNGVLAAPIHLGIPTLRRMNQMGKQFQQCRKAVRQTPTWYLGIITIPPEQQGKGAGTRLLTDHILPRIAQKCAGTPVVLYTQEPWLVKLYEKFGFEIRDKRQIKIPGNPAGFTNYTMIRE